MNPDQPPAPTPNVSETPRTDEVILSNVDMLTRGYKMRLLAESLERELAEVTKERDDFKAINDRKWYDSETYRAQLAAVTKERDTLHDWKESALSILNEINFLEVGESLGLAPGLSVAKNILPGIRALQEKLAMATIERDEAKERADNMESERDHAEANMDAALARAEKAEEDTRRLDWLEHDMTRLVQYTEPDLDGSNYRLEYFSRPGHKAVQSTSIRAAIDAALTPTKEPAP